jgi:CheY-like chemotaxis protein
MDKHSKIVVVVDDNADVRELIVLILESEGFKTLQASNGLEALTILDSQQCDLVLLDVMMPEMSGIEVVKRIRKDLMHRKLPILMITAQTSIDDVEEAILQGANSYLVKPFKADQLLHQIAQVIGQV